MSFPRKHLHGSGSSSMLQIVFYLISWQHDIKKTIWVFPKIVAPPKWMVYNGKPYWNGWFGGTTIFGNIHIDTFSAMGSLKSQALLEDYFQEVVGDLLRARVYHYLLLCKGCGETNLSAGSLKRDIHLKSWRILANKIPPPKKKTPHNKTRHLKVKKCPTKIEFMVINKCTFG